MERFLRGAVTALLAVGLLALPAQAATNGTDLRELVVQGPGAVAALAKAGARIAADLPLIDGVLARVPQDKVAQVGQAPGVTSVVDAKRPIQVQSSGQDAAGASGHGAAALTGAEAAWSRTTGRGVAVAVLDTGIADSDDLRVVGRADLTGEQTFEDSYGHGTFMAGLVAGRGKHDGPSGVAPGADLVDLKVADRDGATTLGQVLYALQLTDWSREHFNIKVLNLSLGAPASDPATGPLTEAVERLWADGVTVVTAAGNDGAITAPGIDPYVITVGALDNGDRSGRRDDREASWSGRGVDYAGRAKPDLLAPGVGTVSLRAPGSTIDVGYPSARVGKRWFRGSGTSMSTGVVSGAAALVAAAHPGWSPDEIKGALVGTTRAVAGTERRTLDVAAAVKLRRADAANDDLLSLGSAEDVDAPADPGSRATSMRWREGNWDGERWGARQWGARQWAGADWDARQWAAEGWNARQWAARQWAARQWAARQWAARQWASAGWEPENWAALQWTWAAPVGWSPSEDDVDADWLARQWAGRQWAGRQWAARQWVARQWVARQWAARQWTGRQWAGRQWAGRQWAAVAWDGPES